MHQVSQGPSHGMLGAGGKSPTDCHVVEGTYHTVHYITLLFNCLLRTNSNPGYADRL